jgi:hypothetical protein
MTEELLDAAACAAIGCHTREESAVYARELAAAGAAGAATDRKMRETAAALAAASPHLKPSNDLRARILHATAPKSFRLEDYRRASRDDVRYYKWGFVAAAVFLVMAGLYNIDTRGRLDQANANFKTLQQKAQQLAKVDQDRIDSVLAASQVQGIPFQCTDEKGNAFARGTLDLQKKTAVMYFPQEMMAAGFQPQLNLDVNGVRQAFSTTVIPVPAQLANLYVPEHIPNHFEFKNQAPETNPQIRNASFFSH